MKKIFITIAICLLTGLSSIFAAENGVIKIVVLGSSTAAGSGPTNIAKAWVNQFRHYAQSKNASSEVINLAAGYYTTYHLMPTGTTPAAGKPAPDPERNITKALSHYPDAIIINLPTNDANNGFTVAEQMNNYAQIISKASAQKVPVYVSTTQPRNGSLELRQNLMAVRDSTKKKLGKFAVDFWTDIANEDGTIKPIYDYGDGVHLNDAAHTILANRVKATDILSFSHAENEPDTINIDLGTTLSTGGWNNLDNAYADTVLNLVNTKIKGTGISAYINDPFTGVNTTGTTSPDAAIGFPSSATSDSFFGSVGAHGGIMEPTGGILLTGLDRNTKYSFTFFASRTGVTDNRETQYKVIGQITDSVSLNASDNKANVAVLKDIFPAANGTIIIKVSPGKNNNNAAKYYFLGAIRITTAKQAVVYDADGTINVDLGSTLSTGAWNNLTNPTGGEVLSDLVNTEGNSSGISMWVHDSFTGINLAGTTAPEASTEMPSSATSDSFFGSTGAHSGVIEATGGVTLGNLSQTSKYTISLFASRDGATDNREAKYVVTGKTTQTVYLDASNNKSKLAVVADMVPASDGTIKIDVSPGANNNNSLKYYYLGAVRIKYGPATSGLSPVKVTGSLSAKIYPNPVKNFVTFDCTTLEAGKIEINIYNIHGQLEQVLSAKSEAGSNCSISWNGTNKFGNKLGKGVYMCRINLTTSNNTFTNTEKLVIE